MAVLRNEIAEDRAKEERGERVQPNKMKENKSKLRQMEALELMEKKGAYYKLYMAQFAELG